MKVLEFPRYCWHCKEDSIIQTRVPYTVQTPTEAIFIPDLIVNKCIKCERLLFDLETDDQINKAIDNH